MRPGRLWILAILLAAANQSCSKAVDARQVALGDSIRVQLNLVGSRLRSFATRPMSGGHDSVIFPGTRPRVLVVIDEADCLSCVNLVYEAWQLHRWIRSRGGDIIGLAAVRPGGVVKQYSRENRLPFTLFSDTSGVLRRQFGMAAHPLVVVVGADGSVLWAAVRNSASTDLSPIDVLLRDLDSARLLPEVSAVQ